MDVYKFCSSVVVISEKFCCHPTQIGILVLVSGSSGNANILGFDIDYN